ncbi:hypothetical protein H4R18_000810 [Coemansia javaensis]|uniref:Protein kinase domain-containing protein n=1 Tax=Coemansia javaensis TaxID=2761396 RepID=A0A9W8LLM5_9FUNG|nr:hypothetical protein H4R18_000810 [Coemansia javaensis]
MYVRQHPTYRRLSARFGAGQAVAADGGERSAQDFIGWERIGRGGFGRVYRARARDGRRYGGGHVAIKVVDKRALKDSAAEVRLATEVAVHEKIRHPHVVRLYDSFEDDRYVYMVMEYCEGGDLWRYLRQHHQQGSGGSGGGGAELAALDEDEARTVMAQVAAAVAHLHASGVMHRDLKLANIMLTREMEVRVGDFGLATCVQNSVEPMTMCGTPSYISPEIMARRPYGFESDVWALGCLLVTLLTGAQPFRNVRQITDDTVARIALPPMLSPNARHLVRSLLRVDPARRIRSDELLDHPFFAAAAPALAPAPAPAPAQPRRLLPPRHPGALPLAAERVPPVSAADGVPLTAHSRAASDELPPFARPGGHQRRSEADYPSQQRRSVADYPSRQRHHPVLRGGDGAGGGGGSGHVGEPQATATQHGGGAVDLDALDLRRLRPMRRTLKSGRVVVREDRVLVLDLTTSATVVVVDAQRREIYEFRRPAPEALRACDAARIHAWDMGALPERVAKTVRAGCRCVAYLLSQQKRLRMDTPQGRAYMFDDLSTFRIAFFNRIVVGVSRARMEATVEIPSSQDLPNEIQKIALCAADFPGLFPDNDDDDDAGGEDDDDEGPSAFSPVPRPHRRRRAPTAAGAAAGASVPTKLRGIWDHAREAVRQMCVFDAVLREFEPGGRMAGRYDGQIAFPVQLRWGWDPTEEYLPPGLVRPDPRLGGLRAGAAQSASAALTGASTTVVMGARHAGSGAVGVGAPGPHARMRTAAAAAAAAAAVAAPATPAGAEQWGAHMLDRRTVDDTPTRRLNLGPITRLVEEFNRMAKPAPGGAAAAAAAAGALHTPGALLRTPGAAKGAAAAAGHEALALALDTAGFIPGVGWCMAAEGADADDHLVAILFCDGCRILVKVRSQLVCFRDQSAEYEDLPFDHSMPVRVKERLSWLPRFLAAMGLAA